MLGERKFLKDRINFNKGNICFSITWVVLGFEKSPINVYSFPSLITHITDCEVFIYEKNINGYKRSAKFTGRSYCCVLDDYNTLKGEKISLERAISLLPRDIRIEIWERFWELQDLK